MPLSWNEIRDRATEFAHHWKDETSEDAEAKSFWDALFDVYGVNRRRVALFEHEVDKLKGKGYIDLLWKGKLLVEHKSGGKDLTRAHNQAKDYFPGLKDSELPRYVVVCNFQQFRVYDLESNNEPVEFALKDLPKNIKHLGFIAGYNKTQETREEDPVNIKAAEMMGRLHDKLKEIGYTGHQLEVYLVRLVFCLFADDTTIFEENTFEDFIKERTSEDGSDLASRLGELFQVLNTPEDKRFKNIDEQLGAFPYVNGKLFEEQLPNASFDSKMRQMLLDSTALNWGSISPAIFGSLFQSVMDATARRNLGAHYTSEKNILKLIKPLFLDELREEFESIKKNKKKLEAFHAKLGTLRFFDPACGCGNFLVITYRELRLLELDVLKALYGDQLGTSLKEVTWVNVDQFYGIELEEFPAQISMVAMWLIDHQMNMLCSNVFGEYYRRLPLTKSAHITNGNALRIDWDRVVPNKDENLFVLGNPPFGGKHYQSAAQREDQRLVTEKIKSGSDLDFVACWFIKAAEFIKGTKITFAFVATNSITQGEQVPLLWGFLFNVIGLKIKFAHRTFQWKNEAKGVAGVQCVIIGLSVADHRIKLLFEYPTPKGDPLVREVKNIGPYLIEGPDTFVTKQQKPLGVVPEMRCGSKPSDGGNLILTEADRQELITKEPNASKYLKQYIGSEEFINGKPRWCLWLSDISPSELRSMPFVLSRVQAVREFRSASTAKPTRAAADTPARFFFEAQPENEYILVPEVSSERRQYIPMGFMTPDVISSNKNYLIAQPNKYLFGILQSQMHMAWTRIVSGRLESRFQYSASMVYNTFPWPQSPSEAQKKKIEDAAQAVLDARAAYPNSTLADLYDPLAMPKPLLDAHKKLDAAVDASYRKAPFTSELERLEYLFGMYKELTKDLFTEGKKKGKRK